MKVQTVVIDVSIVVGIKNHGNVLHSVLQMHSCSLFLHIADMAVFTNRIFLILSSRYILSSGGKHPLQPLAHISKSKDRIVIFFSEEKNSWNQS